MELRLRMALLVISAALIVFIIDLVRRQRLKEKYSLLWLMMGLVIIAMIVWPRFGFFIKDMFGVEVLSNMVFLAAMLFIVILCIHFSVRISTLSEQTKVLAQEMAILKNRTESLRVHGGIVDGEREFR